MIALYCYCPSRCGMCFRFLLVAIPTPHVRAHAIYCSGRSAPDLPFFPVRTNFPFPTDPLRVTPHAWFTRPLSRTYRLRLAFAGCWWFNTFAITLGLPLRILVPLTRLPLRLMPRLHTVALPHGCCICPDIVYDVRLLQLVRHVLALPYPLPYETGLFGSRMPSTVLAVEFYTGLHS